MTRQEIREMFYAQTKEADPNRNAPAVTLNSWLKEGNIDFCMQTYCLVDEYTTTTTLDKRYYDLESLEPLFFDVDINSGGVWYDDDFLVQTTQAQLSNKSKGWRSNLSGTVTEWYLRGSTLWLNKNPEDAKELIVSIARKPADLINDSQKPFDELNYLEPFHIALVKYLQMRFKGSLEKNEGLIISRQEYQEYINACKKKLSRGRSGSSRIEPMAGIYQPICG